MKEEELEKSFSLAVELATKAGQMMQEAFNLEKKVNTKSCGADLVTETDEAIEKLILSEIREQFPDHRFIGEESVAAGLAAELGDEPTWIVDPVDGTTNFVHGIPYFAVSIGFAVDKEIEFGLVYNGITETMYSARKGRGAFCNGERMQVSGNKELATSVIIAEMGSQREPDVVDKKMQTIRNVVMNSHGLRSRGSAALNMCLVAAGEAAAYYEIGIHCWDIAAGAVIVREAGGHVGDTGGGPLDLMSRRVIAACTEALAQQLVPHIVPLNMDRD